MDINSLKLKSLEDIMGWADEKMLGKLKKPELAAELPGDAPEAEEGKMEVTKLEIDKDTEGLGEEEAMDPEMMKQLMEHLGSIVGEKEEELI